MIGCYPLINKMAKDVSNFEIWNDQLVWSQNERNEELQNGCQVNRILKGNLI